MPKQEELIESVAMARQANDALSAICSILSQTEEGSTVECRQLAALLMLVRDAVYTVVSDLQPVAGVDS